MTEHKPSASKNESGQVKLVPVEPYLKTPTGYDLNPVMFSTKAHAYVVRGAQLMVVPLPVPRIQLPDTLPPFARNWPKIPNAPVWPLAGYYAYMDTDLTSKVDFDSLGLLWTDETGTLHVTDGQGRPTERLSHFVTRWSTDSDANERLSAALIYDHDLERLNKKKKQVEQSAKHGGIADKYRIGTGQMFMFPDRARGGAGVVITVPEDPEVLDVKDLLDFMASCNQAMDEAHKAQQKVTDYVKENEENQVMYFYRTQIDDWLNQTGQWRRHHLTPLNPSQYMWDVECQNFDRYLQRKLDAYDKALDPLYDILTSDEKREKLGDIGMVLDGWEDPNGGHLLWRHQFLTEAAGMFCGTPRQKKVFELVVQPLFQGFSFLWSELRVKCKCPTCQGMAADPAIFGNPDKDLLKHVGWKSKDLKIATSTGLRLIDLCTKFVPNWAFVFVRMTSSQAFKDLGFLSWSLMIRCGWIGPGARTEDAANAWLKLVEDLAVSAKKGEGTLEKAVAKIPAFLHPKLQVKTEVFLGKLGGVINMFGGGIAIYAVVTKDGKLNVKDAMDLSRGITDMLRGGMGVGKKKLEETLVAKLGPELGKQWAKALPKWLSIAGAAMQVGTSWMSLNEAADKGDGRALGWSAVQYTGADIALTGAVLDVCPEPVVTKGSGVVLNFVGGSIYLVGQLGEFLTRPGAEEKFLRGHYLYDDGDHWKAGEEAEYEKQQEQEYEARRLERIERNSYRR